MTIPKFDYIDDDVNNASYLKILEGNFEGLLFNYGKVQFNEDEDADEAKLKFTYNIIDNPNECVYNDELVSVLGDILVTVMTEQLKEN